MRGSKNPEPLRAIGIRVTPSTVERLNAELARRKAESPHAIPSMSDVTRELLTIALDMLDSARRSKAG